MQNVVHLPEELIRNKGTQAPQSHLSWWFSAQDIYKLFAFKTSDMLCKYLLPRLSRVEMAGSNTSTQPKKQPQPGLAHAGGSSQKQAEVVRSTSRNLPPKNLSSRHVQASWPAWCPDTRPFAPSPNTGPAYLYCPESLPLLPHGTCNLLCSDNSQTCFVFFFLSF